MISNRRRRELLKRRQKRIAIAAASLILCAALFFGGRFLLQYLSGLEPVGDEQSDPLTVTTEPQETAAPQTKAPTTAPTSAPASEAEEAIIIPPNPAALAPDSAGDVVVPSSTQVTGALPQMGAVASAESLTTEPEPGAEKEGEGEEPASDGADEQAAGELRFSGLKIGIDPGHQAKGNNDKEPIAPGSSETKAKVSSGTSGNSTKIPEHVTNLEISLKLREALLALGAEVYMTRETADVDISNVERAMMMNELDVDIVLRIHCNGSTNTSANGIGLYVRDTGEGAEECLKAAEALMPEMIAATGAREDGIFRRDTYTGLNWSTVPCILVEMGFMTNEKEDQLLNSPDYQDKLVAGMVEGIANYLLNS